MTDSLNGSAIYMRVRAAGASDGIATKSARLVQTLADNDKALSLLKLPLKSLQLTNVVRLDNPYAAVALFSSVAVSKALILAGVILPEDKAACARAIAAVACDGVVDGVVAGTGVGIPAAALMAISTTIDMYNVQQKCFVGEQGQVSHAVYLHTPPAAVKTRQGS